MKKAGLAIFAIVILGASAHAQNRVFDNLDTASGGNVYRPPAPDPRPLFAKLQPAPAGSALRVYELHLDESGNVLRYERTHMRRRCDLGR